MKKVITYGTFDLLHVGHIRLLKQAKAFGNYLIVGLSTDAFNAEKHKSSFMGYETRKELLEAIRYVDKVIPEKNWEQKKNDIIQHNVDIFVMGDDWKGHFDFLGEFCEVLYLPRTQDISSSALKSIYNNNGKAYK